MLPGVAIEGQDSSVYSSCVTVVWRSEASHHVLPLPSCSPSLLSGILHAAREINIFWENPSLPEALGCF